MKESQTSGEKPASTRRTKGAPIGTHSLTGNPANVGMPSPPGAHAKAKQPSSNSAEPDDASEVHVPVPDEDGPHDVPDETVIEKTLPSVPIPDTPGSGSERTR